MSDTDLHETMNLIAADAGAPPADLLDRVAAGRRRHRRRQTVVAAFAAVVLLAGAAWAGLRPPAERTDIPARPTGHGPFRLPPSVADPPLISVAWPGANVTAQEPPTTPDGKRVHILDRIDGGALLMGGGGTFYAWSTLDRVFRPVVTGIDANTGRSGVVVTPRWIVWMAGDPRADTGISVYRAPRGGGPKQLVTVVRQPLFYAGDLYATDDHAYWSTRDGVLRVSLSDGGASLLAGYENLVTDGTAWATGAQPGPEQTTRPRPAVFKNLVTGEERLVRPATEVDPESLQCIPAFCLASAQDGDAWFVQRPDGSHLTKLPYPGRPSTLGATGDSGIIVLAGEVLLDPVTGRFGTATRERQSGCLQRSGAVKGEFTYRWAVTRGDGCGPRQLAYIDGSG